jgi:hypothetical protein
MPNKFQNVSFKSIEELLNYLPQDEYVTGQYLREMIFYVCLQFKRKYHTTFPFTE